MRRCYALSIVAAVLLLAAPARAEDVRSQLEAATAKMGTDFAAGDAKALAAAYAEDAMMLPPEATRVSGRAAIEALWQSWIDGGIKNLTLKVTDLDVGEDVGYQVGDLTLAMPGEEGELSPAHGTYLFVWKKGEDGVWRVKVDTWNGPVVVEAGAPSD